MADMADDLAAIISWNIELVHRRLVTEKLA